jgi:hypothetical protein
LDGILSGNREDVFNSLYIKNTNMKNILTILFLLKSLLIISQNNNKKSSVVIEGGGEIKTEIKFNNSVKISNQQTQN